MKIIATIKRDGNHGGSNYSVLVYSGESRACGNFQSPLGQHMGTTQVPWATVPGRYVISHGSLPCCPGLKPLAWASSPDPPGKQSTQTKCTKSLLLCLNLQFLKTWQARQEAAIKVSLGSRTGCHGFLIQPGQGPQHHFCVLVPYSLGCAHQNTRCTCVCLMYGCTTTHPAASC